MKSFAVASGIAVFIVASQAYAIDAVSIRNTTDQQLSYKMRCANPGSEWKNFSTQPKDTSRITAQTCTRFGFEMSTKNTDGSKVTVNYGLDPNAWYRLIYNREKIAGICVKSSKQIFEGAGFRQPAP